MCKNGDDTKVFTFGIGKGCDEDLVTRSAISGRGSSSVVEDADPEGLKEMVINSLKNASEPALQNCSISFNNEISNLG